MSLNNLSVRFKVISAFAAIFAATIALGFYAIQEASAINDRAAELRDNWLPASHDLGQMDYFAMRYRQRQAVYILYSSATDRAKEVQNLTAIAADYDTAWHSYSATIDTDYEKNLAQEIDGKWHAFVDLQEQLTTLAGAGGQDAAFHFYVGGMKRGFDDFKKSLDEDIAYQQKAGTAAGNRGKDVYESARLFIMAALGLTALLCLGAGFYLIWAVSRPLTLMTGAMGELAGGNLNVHVPATDRGDEIGQLAGAMTMFKDKLAAAERERGEQEAALERAKEEQTKIIVDSIGEGLSNLAKGDLTHRISAQLEGAYAKLKDDFNSAAARLQETLKQVLDSTGLINVGAREISVAADSLSKRTEQQAASLEETAAALEQITATVKNTAQNAREANAVAATAKTAAESGGAVVQSAVEAMGEISQSSRQITDIIGVIDEIAFQTNLLALNAGVEAARAGDAGRGFAVVASEVRALAQRSSDAAKQIKTLIKASGDHVSAGVKLVDESGQALKRIVGEVARIDALVDGMARAAEQQSTGIGQVNTAVTQMDQGTQQNAAMVEESTAASRNLAEKTDELTRLVSFFKVDDGQDNSEWTKPKSQEQRARSRLTVVAAPRGAR